MGLWLIKCLGIIISLIGYTALVRRIFNRLPLFFVPICSVSILANILLIAGYLNILGSTASPVVWIGIALCAFFAGKLIFTKAAHADFNKYDIVYCVIWSVSALLMAVFLYGRYNITHDDYSHWGIIVKRMLENNALPTGADPFIQFQSYPEGISVWNYFVCRFAGGEDWTMQWAQFLVNWACLFPLFHAVGNKKMLGIIIVPVYSVLVLNVNVPLYSSLSVDTVISLVGVIPVIMLLQYLRSRDEKTESFCSIGPYNYETIQTATAQALILGFCTMIKSSGIFFWLFFVCIFAAYYHGKNKKEMTAILITIPAVINILWQIYFNIAFPDGNMSNHAISLTRYINIISTRTVSDVLKTIYYFFANSYGLECYYTVVVMLLLYSSIRASRKIAADTAILKIDICAFVSWMVCLLAMYLFSMQDSEVYKIISIDRYRRTIELFMYMTWSTFLIRAVTNDISYSDMVRKLKHFIKNIKNIFEKIGKQLHNEVTKEEIKGFLIKIREPLTVIAFAVMLLSMPKNPYGPWTIWKMNINVRLDLEQAISDGTLTSEDYVIIYNNNKYFRNWNRDDLKYALANKEYYIAQYTLNSLNFSMYNNWNDIEKYCKSHPQSKIVVYFSNYDSITGEINKKYGFDEYNKIIRIQDNSSN